MPFPNPLACMLTSPAAPTCVLAFGYDHPDNDPDEDDEREEAERELFAGNIMELMTHHTLLRWLRDEKRKLRDKPLAGSQFVKERTQVPTGIPKSDLKEPNLGPYALSEPRVTLQFGCYFSVISLGWLILLWVSLGP
eukprot:scaffold124304_cov23-Tisochrysis_lutea.AAC.1